MKAFIAYTNRGCVTGKQLRQALSAKRKRTDRRAKCDLFIRWGSTEQFDNLRYKKELNTRDAVIRTSSKLLMLQTLAAAGVSTLEFDTDPANLANSSLS